MIGVIGVIVILIIGFVGAGYYFYGDKISTAKAIGEELSEDCESVEEVKQYNEERCKNKEILYEKNQGNCIQYTSKNKPASARCIIKNTDNISGTFVVEVGFERNGEKVVEVKEKVINAGSSEIFEVQESETIDTCYCNVISAPTKETCEIVTKNMTLKKCK